METSDLKTATINVLSEQERKERTNVRQLLKDNYKFSNELTAHHISFLKDLEQNEVDRLSGIESKLSSIIGQCGLIFTIIALFIPLFLNDLSNVHIILKILYCLLFILGLFCFTRSILAASATLRIYDFPYARPDINSSFAETIKTKEIFFEGQVKDLITTISINTASNNEKGNNLITAHRFFVFGLVIMGALGLMLTFQSLLYKKETDPDIAIVKTVILMESQINDSRNLLDQLILQRSMSKDSIDIIRINKTLDSVNSSLNKLKNQYKIKGITKF